MQSGTSDRYQLKCDVKDEASMVLTFETAHRRYNEHAKCSCVLKELNMGHQGLEQSEDKGHPGVQSRYGATEPLLWAGSLAAVLTSFPGRWTSLTSWIH
jgi:hypothetical protein